MALGRTFRVELDVATYRAALDSVSTEKYPRSDFHSRKKNFASAEVLVVLAFGSYESDSRYLPTGTLADFSDRAIIF